jgi:hypothetical protein
LVLDRPNESFQSTYQSLPLQMKHLQG